MSIVLQGSTSGSVTLQEPAVAGTTVLDLPAVSGTVLTSASTITPSDGSVTQAKLATGVAGTGPAFSAYSSSSLSVSSATWTKLEINTEEYDTANCFNTSTYRFTPNVAGYYHFTGQYDIATGSPTRAIIAVRKNDDTTRANGNDIGPSSGNLSNGAGMVVSKIWYMNGSTDYVELFCFLTGGATVDLNAYFQGLMVRAA